MINTFPYAQKLSWEKDLNEESSQGNNQHFTFYPKVRRLPSPPLACVPRAAAPTSAQPCSSGPWHTDNQNLFTLHMVLLGEAVKWLQPGFPSAEWQTPVPWKILNSPTNPGNVGSLSCPTHSFSLLRPELSKHNHPPPNCREHTPSLPELPWKPPLKICGLCWKVASCPLLPGDAGVRKSQCSPQKSYKPSQYMSWIRQFPPTISPPPWYWMYLSIIKLLFSILCI